ncbi:hypothetical protein KY46_12345 [Photobacterium halotolerans]|uniref:Uncharacterized protein n=1 Tax=Photobacterium halotolerans TaxID=265726 RepID=A0A0F5VCB6_9GAMM|nr:hypothetical protein KY46_12345 [Photobacterium halotolerans]
MIIAISLSLKFPFHLHDNHRFNQLYSLFPRFLQVARISGNLAGTDVFIDQLKRFSNHTLPKKCFCFGEIE